MMGIFERIRSKSKTQSWLLRPIVEYGSSRQRHFVDQNRHSSGELPIATRYTAKSIGLAHGQ